MSTEHERRECEGHLAAIRARHDARLRLLSVKERNDLARERRASMASRFQTMEHRQENGTAPRAVSSFNLFPTPPAIAERMVALADIRAGHRVLEPSAGTGRLLDWMPADATTTSCEVSRVLCGLLYHRYPGITIKAGDFLERTSESLGGPFDRIVMNPPFYRGEDVKHILHARTMLAPGGLLVSLCYAGESQHTKLHDIAESWELLPAGSFKTEGTEAGVVLLTLKPSRTKGTP